MAYCVHVSRLSENERAPRLQKRSTSVTTDVIDSVCASNHCDVKGVASYVCMGISNENTVMLGCTYTEVFACAFLTHLLHFLCSGLLIRWMDMKSAVLITTYVHMYTYGDH